MRIEPATPPLVCCSPSPFLAHQPKCACGSRRLYELSKVAATLWQPFLDEPFRLRKIVRSAKRVLIDFSRN